MIIGKVIRAFPWILIGTHYIIPNDKVKNTMTDMFYKMGVAITFGMSKHPSVGPLWNKTMEPLFVDLIDNVAFSIQNGLVKGLRSDNEPSSSVPEQPRPSET